MSTLEFDASLMTNEELRRMLARLEIPFEWSTSVHVAPRYQAVQAIMRAAEAAHDRLRAAERAYLTDVEVTAAVEAELIEAQREWAKFTKRA